MIKTRHSSFSFYSQHGGGRYLQTFSLDMKCYWYMKKRLTGWYWMDITHSVKKYTPSNLHRKKLILMWSCITCMQKDGDANLFAWGVLIQINLSSHFPMQDSWNDFKFCLKLEVATDNAVLMWQSWLCLQCLFSVLLVGLSCLHWVR